MKKLPATILAAFVMLALTACGADYEEETGPRETRTTEAGVNTPTLPDVTENAPPKSSKST
jgi:hypothetical protein